MNPSSLIMDPRSFIIDTSSFIIGTSSIFAVFKWSKMIARIPGLEWEFYSRIIVFSLCDFGQVSSSLWISTYSLKQWNVWHKNCLRPYPALAFYNFVFLICTIRWKGTISVPAQNPGPHQNVTTDWAPLEKPIFVQNLPEWRAPQEKWNRLRINFVSSLYSSFLKCW